ncbi:hypothetical protein ACLOJK_011687 [Asimina triloba]
MPRSLEAVGSKTLADLIERIASIGKLTVPLEVDRVEVPGLPPLEISDMLTIFSASGFQPSYLPLVMKPFSNISKADWVLLNTFDKLEPEKSCDCMENSKGSRTHCAIRVPDDRDYNINLQNPETRACIKWLDERATSAVVYISFGSVATLCVEQTEEVEFHTRSIELGSAPMACTPQRTDQPTNAKWAEDVLGGGIEA